MDFETVFVGHGDACLHVRRGGHGSAGEIVRVFEDQEGDLGSEVRPGSFRGGNVSSQNVPSRGHDRAGDDSGKSRHAGELVVDNVRVRVAQHFVAGARPKADGDFVRHHSGRHEKRRLETEHRRHPLLEPDGRGILAKDIVAHFRLGHGFSHGVGRPGDRIRSQIDDSVHGRHAKPAPARGSNHRRKTKLWPF